LIRRAALLALALLAAGGASAQPAAHRYGLIGQMKAMPGKRAELAAILLEGTATMPGCLGYLIAEDAKDPDALWITETWDSKASHDASPSLPAVRAAIAKGRPLIAGFSQRIETVPLGDAKSSHD
jgi:quinol monooxygenase YgiN